MTKQPKILITGGTGFAGSHLVEALLAQGKQKIHVTAYQDQSNIVHQLIPHEAIHQLDLTKTKPTTKLIAQIQPDQIYHLAALAAVGKSFAQTRSVLNNNLQLQLNLLEAVKTHAPQARVLIVGSAMEYAPQNQPLKETDPLGPASPYAVSKITQDMLGYAYQQSCKLNIVRCRPFNHLGERQASGFVVPDFAQQIINIEQGQQQQLKVGNLAAVRDFTDVKDVVKAYILLMKQGQTGEVYNIGSGQGYSIQQLLDWLIELSSIKIKVEVDQQKLRPVDIPKVIADNSKIAALGWQPTIKIKDTLARVLNHMRSTT
ncbi:MAG: NAD-dependent epimerase/dehydratase family protein [Candidatus Pacebacteria bacterium]|nr:NAD-dependent epimerase/dehydratase family protein [Candidatus Paceibacterota bacterium]